MYITQSVSATLFADAVNGWKSTLVTCIAAFIFGFIWLAFMLGKPTCVLNVAIIIANIGMLLFAGVFVISYFGIAPPEGMEVSVSILVDTGVQTTVLVAAAAAICFLFYIWYKSYRLRNDFGNASKVFALTSEALRDCNIAIIYANCCLPSNQNLNNSDSKNEEKVVDSSDVELQQTVKPREVNIRPILTFPIYNFIILMSFIALWILVFLHLISLGKIEQKCQCIKSLENCTCSRYFEFDEGARWFALIHVYQSAGHAHQ